MNDYASALRAHAAHAQQQHKTQKASTAAKVYTPLPEQIAALMAGLPPSVRNRPWAITELLPRLQGKYRDRPRNLDVACALKQLGYRQVRCWHKGALGHRFWLPPGLKSPWGPAIYE